MTIRLIPRGAVWQQFATKFFLRNNRQFLCLVIVARFTSWEELGNKLDG
jgi:hypothetical protein